MTKENIFYPKAGDFFTTAKRESIHPGVVWECLHPGMPGTDVCFAVNRNNGEQELFCIGDQVRQLAGAELKRSLFRASLDRLVNASDEGELNDDLVISVIRTIAGTWFPDPDMQIGINLNQATKDVLKERAGLILEGGEDRTHEGFTKSSLANAACEMIGSACFASNISSRRDRLVRGAAMAIAAIEKFDREEADKQEIEKIEQTRF